jgi:hypothetical protein
MSAALWCQLRKCRFEFQKNRQPFIRTHDEALTVAAMCASSEDRLSVTIYG